MRESSSCKVHNSRPVMKITSVSLLFSAISLSLYPASEPLYDCGICIYSCNYLIRNVANLTKKTLTCMLLAYDSNSECDSLFDKSWTSLYYIIQIMISNVHTELKFRLFRCRAANTGAGSATRNRISQWI